MKIEHPVRYKRCIIAPAPEHKGFDVFDGSGRWFNVVDQRRAKWWASIHDRLETEFGTGYRKQVPEVST